MQLFLWKSTQNAREFTVTEQYKNSFWLPRSLTDYIQIWPRRPGETFNECEVKFPEWKKAELLKQGLI